MVRTLALDLSVLHETHPAGVARYARELAGALSTVMPSWRVVGICPSTDGLGDLAGRVEILTDGARWPRPLWRRWVLPRLAKRVGADVLHVPVSHTPRARGLIVTRCVHDVAAAVGGHDGYGGSRRGEVRRLARSIPTVFPSSATQGEFRKVVPSFAAPSTVIHHGVEPRFFDSATSSLDLPEVFGLVVGTVRPRRRPDLLEAALQGADLSPVLWAGHGHVPTLDPPIECKGISFLGPVSEADLRELYARARFVVLPSEVEGFGLPLIEAQAAGCTVVAADAPVLREIGGGWPVYFEPGNSQSLRTAIAFALATPDDSLTRLPRLHARRFTWERSAQAHAAFFESLLDR